MRFEEVNGEFVKFFVLFCSVLFCSVIVIVIV